MNKTRERYCVRKLYNDNLTNAINSAANAIAALSELANNSCYLQLETEIKDGIEIGKVLRIVALPDPLPWEFKGKLGEYLNADQSSEIFIDASYLFPNLEIYVNTKESSE